MQDKVVVVFHEAMLEHRPEGWHPTHPEWLTPQQLALLKEVAPDGARWGHPERPERLVAIRAMLEERPIDGLEWATPQPADRVMLQRVHQAEYLDRVESLRGCSAWLHFDTTAVSPGSVEAAQYAAGAAVSMVESIIQGPVSRGLALVRPPGHHAGADLQPKGFCLYNNLAVAAAHARERLGVGRILIVDWDIHHGNGTEAIFNADPDVLLFDTHRAAPFYPGTGDLEHTGIGPGKGATVNVPLPDLAGDHAVLCAFERILLPLADRFRPELVLVSAGFDAHREDGNMTMSEGGFAALCGLVRQIADRHARGRLGLCLEGGYNTAALAACTHATLLALTGGTPPPPERHLDDPGLPAVEQAVRFHQASRSARD